MQTNKRTLHFIDQTSEKGHHMVFNSSMIKVLQLSFSDANIVYWGIPSNQKETLELLTNEEKQKCIIEPIKYYKTKSNSLFIKGFFYIYKEITRVKHFYKVLKKTNSNDAIVLSITTFTAFLIFKILHKYINRPTYAVLHGDIDFLYNSKSKIEKLNAWCHKRIFKIKSKNFTYILLNKISKKKLCEDGFLNSNEVIEINHPYSNLNQEVAVKMPSGIIQLGHIGSMEVARKNSHFLYKIAADFQIEITNDKLNFETIGLITPDIIPHKNKWVIERVGNSKPDKPDYLTRQEYEKYLSDLHFTLFFIDQQQYIFRTSGAIIDTIAFQKPIIAFKHPYFDFLVEQVGPIGYFFDTKEKLNEKVIEIIKGSVQIQNEYETFISNLANLRKIFSVEKVSVDFQQQLKNIT